MKKALFFSIIAAGFTAAGAQILLLREFLIVFHGNELSVGLVLAIWLAATAAGSLLAGRMSEKIHRPVAVLSALHLAVALALPVVFIAVKSVRSAAGLNVGEVAPLSHAVIAGLAMISPLCLLSGSLFPLACLALAASRSSQSGPITPVYSLEAAGSLLGGALTSILLIPLQSSLSGVMVMVLVSLCSSFLLARQAEKSFAGKALSAGAFVLGVIAVFCSLNGSWQRLELGLVERQWRGFQVPAARNSRYGNLVLVKQDDEFSFYYNGVSLYTLPGGQRAEETAHFALLEHPAPSDLLLIGGGAGGVLAEVLKHPVFRVDYVELDPAIIAMSREHLPAVHIRPLDDPRVRVYNDDGRSFAGNPRRSYDCVILDAGDPFTAQQNRYYTAEFFRLVKRILNKDGILSFSLSSSESYIDKETADVLRSVYAAVSEVFPDVKVIPGDRAIFMACSQKGLLTYDLRILMERAAQRRLDLRYVREYFLESRLSPRRIAWNESALAAPRRIAVNRDLKPAAYFYQMISWSHRFRDRMFVFLLSSLSERKVWLVMAAVFLMLGLYLFRGGNILRTRQRAVSAAVLTTGLSGMVCEMLLLFSFQAVYGCLFYKLGAIVTSFMAGIVAGSWLVLRLPILLPQEERSIFIRCQTAICVYPLLVIWFAVWQSSAGAAAFAWAGENIFFPLMTAAAGLMAGFQFPLASRIRLANGALVGRVAGSNYALDLAGACLGALAAGPVLIPLAGVPGVCLMLSALSFLVLLALKKQTFA